MLKSNGFSIRRSKSPRNNHDSIETDNTDLRSEQDGTLRFKNVTREDVGTYKCTAKNTLGQITKELKIVVRGMFSFILLSKIICGKQRKQAVSEPYPPRTPPESPLPPAVRVR